MSSMAAMSSRDLYLAAAPLGESTVNLQANRDTLAAPSLKRRASSSFEEQEEDQSRKRIKEFKETEEVKAESKETPEAESSKLAEELAQELQCGCCSELVYRPVLVTPCQHFFCGSCCVLWVRNGGTNCPACRSVATIVTPFRTMQAIVDTLLRSAPHLTRTERERQQADEVYRAGQSLKIPTPREATPEPNLNQSEDYARPCPHCIPNNAFGWQCPQPVPDPVVDPDRAWPIDDGAPPGHAHCGNCEMLLATLAPSTTKCDFCRVYFCGVGVQDRCVALSLLSQHPHGLTDVSDLIQSPDIYDCFDGNMVEAEIMLDYLRTQRLTPRHVYREIVSHVRAQPQGFGPLLEQDLFTDLHGVAPATDANPDGPWNNICRMCATEVLIWGLKEWWIRERAKGFLEEGLMKRPDCPEGSNCPRQREFAHAREYNHIIPNPPSSESQSEERPAAGPATIAPPVLDPPRPDDSAFTPLERTTFDFSAFI